MTLVDSAQLLGNFGEFFGAIGIVVTMIYLAKQIQENTKSNLVATRNEFADQGGRFMEQYTSDLELAGLVLNKGRDHPDSLNGEERTRYDFQLVKLFLVMSSQYYQYQIGAMDEETFHEADYYMRMIVSGPEMWEWWERSREGFGPKYRAHIDGLVEQAKAGTLAPTRESHASPTG